MNTLELDRELMKQYIVESSLQDLGMQFNLKCDEDESIAEIQIQAPYFCLKSKAFLCSESLKINSPEARFSAFMKQHMNMYKENPLHQKNQMMKPLYSSDINVLHQQISMLTMHAQFKDVEDIFNINEETLRISLNTESLCIGIGLYSYYTLLINKHVKSSSYNELFIKSWYNYYSNWKARLLMFRMNGNNWKIQFKNVLLE